MKENKSSKHDLLKKLMKENDIEIMHLELYLSYNGIVCISEEDYAKIEEVE